MTSISIYDLQKAKSPLLDFAPIKQPLNVVVNNGEEHSPFISNEAFVKTIPVNIIQEAGINNSNQFWYPHNIQQAEEQQTADAFPLPTYSKDIFLVDAENPLPSMEQANPFTPIEASIQPSRKTIRETFTETEKETPLQSQNHLSIKNSPMDTSSVFYSSPMSSIHTYSEPSPDPYPALYYTDINEDPFDYVPESISPLTLPRAVSLSSVKQPSPRGEKRRNSSPQTNSVKKEKPTLEDLKRKAKGIPGTPSVQQATKKHGFVNELKRDPVNQTPGTPSVSNPKKKGNAYERIEKQMKKNTKK